MIEHWVEEGDIVEHKILFSYYSLMLRDYMEHHSTTFYFILKSTFDTPVPHPTPSLEIFCFIVFAKDL